MQDATLEDLQAWARAKMQRAPDVVIGDPDNPYMRRWFIFPRNRFQNVYLHEILRSDDDRAYHDHVGDYRSLIIEGGYVELRPRNWVFPYLGKPIETEYRAGAIIDRQASDLHRLIIPEGGRCVSLWLRGAAVREWGFVTPDGWVPWHTFLGEDYNSASPARVQP